MRMLYSCLGHRSPKDPEFGKLKDCGWGGRAGRGHQNCLWIRLYFVMENYPRARTDILEPLPWRRPELEANWLWALAMLEAWAETLQDGVRKREDMATGTFSVVLNSAPKDYYFLHLQNIVLKSETH